MSLAGILFRIERAVERKSPITLLGSQGSFDHCGVDRNDNYVPLFCAGNVWQLSPTPCCAVGAKGEVDAEVDLIH